MAAELIGRCRCPLCGSDKARLTLAKSQLAVMTCNGCNFQGFARSDRSDTAMRALLVADKPAAPVEPPSTPEPVRTEPTPAPVRTPAPPPAPVRAPVAPKAPPPPPPAPATPPAAAPRQGWGILG